ncbi:MAG: GtrA family protein [Pseudonocardiaceae bacterium]
MLRTLARYPLARLFTRFAAGSVVATGCSQLTFVLLFGVLATSASVSGAGAFLAGAIPNFLIHRFWTWRRCGPVTIHRELLPYLAVVACNGLVAIGVTTCVDRLLGSAIGDHAARTAILDAAFTLSYLPLFVLKFALLDRLVFGSGASWALRRRRAHECPQDDCPQDSRAQVPTSTRA